MDPSIRSNPERPRRRWQDQRTHSAADGKLGRRWGHFIYKFKLESSHVSYCILASVPEARNVNVSETAIKICGGEVTDDRPT